MKFTKLRWLAGISAFVSLYAFSGKETPAADRPHYGGTLRVELRLASVSPDPREWNPGSLAAAEQEKLAALVYDRLITLDDYGNFQPSLALEWSHDAQSRNWQFKLRPNVKFSDGTPLTAADVAAALQSLFPSGWQISALDGGVSLRINRSTPDLLEQLTSGPYFIYRIAKDRTPLGTGPFYLSQSVPAGPAESDSTAIKPARITFRANKDAWTGRPFVDAIEVTLGVPALRQLFDLQVGKADVVDISPELVRRARQEGLRIWSSSPAILLALRFDDSQPASADPRLREALALALDRDTMANVLLQREAQPASALLPQWLTGYAFFFDSTANLDGAKEIRKALPSGEATVSDPLRLRVDAAGDLFKLLGERVAVNARQVNLVLQLVPHIAPRSAMGTNATTDGADSKAGLHLFAWHYSSLSPRAELDAFMKQFAPAQEHEVSAGAADLEQLYAVERRLIEGRHILPLVLLPEYTGLGTNVRNWMPATWGEWRLADVWLQPAEGVEMNGQSSKSNAGKIPGARP
jgi:peptide/nickel transport system substrate-binding protein